MHCCVWVHTFSFFFFTSEEKRVELCLRVCVCVYGRVFIPCRPQGELWLDELKDVFVWSELKCFLQTHTQMRSTLKDQHVQISKCIWWGGGGYSDRAGAAMEGGGSVVKQGRWGGVNKMRADRWQDFENKWAGQKKRRRVKGKNTGEEWWGKEVRGLKTRKEKSTLAR